MKIKITYLLPILATSIFCLTSCGGASDNVKVLRVLNSADYIYEAETKDDEPDMMDQFVTYMKEEKGVTIKYTYDTFDTNETCFNELMTGKSHYDVINVSDYMVQRLISENLIQPLYKESYEEDERVANIRNNISDFLWEKFDNIHPKDYTNNNAYLDCVISQYSVPYMWGTVGVLFNPAFYKNLSEEEALDLFLSWEALYGKETTNSFSIKDSVRDVYAMSVIHTFYESDIKPLEEKYSSGEIDADEFNAEMTKIFNRCEDEHLELIKKDMLRLKDNSFGFEVDSGKTDMIEGKIGANLAWSGDATWAIYEAQCDYDTELYFSIPEEGSNIWFDAFCIPTSATNYDLAIDFIDFMSMPEYAIQNMDYVGYTSAVASDEVLDYFYSSYDVRGEVGLDIEEVKEELEIEEGIDFEDYDVSYFFENALSEEYSAIEDVLILKSWTMDTDYINEDEEPCSCYGRMLRSALPKEELLPKLCVMDDFGTRNKQVLDMWEKVRTNALPLWAVILFIVEGALLLAAIGFAIYKSQTKKTLYKRRHNA